MSRSSWRPTWLPELHPFRPRALHVLRDYDRTRFVADLAAGLTVGIVALPLALAFAIASGVKPEQGLFTAIIAGFLISALGGSNVQIGGPAGAFIVIVYGIVQRYGLANLLISTIMAGMLLFALGALKLGSLVRYIPVSIVIGFTNGIAVLIGLSQLKDFFGLQIPQLPADFFAQIGTLWSHRDSASLTATLIATGSFLCVRLWPKSYTMPEAHMPRWRDTLTRWMAHLPGTLVVLVASSALVWALKLPVDTIGTRFGGIPQALPGFELPSFTFATVKQLVIPTITIALLGAIESLLCARVADNAAPIPKHDPNQELMAQGVANVVVPFFGGIPATGTIARTVTNVRAGGRTPVAGMVHAATLLVIVLVAAPLASLVPLAALAGILLTVAWNMGEWHEFTRLKQFHYTYRTILVGTFVLTVVFDLTVAVEVGLILACVFFIWRMSTLFRVEPQPSDTPETARYALYGALFFGAIGKIEALAERLPSGVRHVVLDAKLLIAMDTSGLDAIVGLQRTLARQGVTLVMERLNEQPAGLIRRAGAADLAG